jgi:hypothetical protein
MLIHSGVMDVEWRFAGNRSNKMALLSAAQNAPWVKYVIVRMPMRNIPQARTTRPAATLFPEYKKDGWF